MNQVTSVREEFSYDDGIARQFVIATLFWALVTFGVGLVIASQLFSWRLNFNIPWLTFGRLRPVHTNAAIFAFAANAVFAGIYYSSQRLLKTRMASDLLSRIHFWGWQFLIVAGVLSLLLGFTQGKEYAELEWPFDIAMAGLWVIFAINFFATIAKRREKHLYVSIWFYIATILTVALLHIFNSLALPVSFLKSYSVFAGVQDAIVQWWYGHNAVAFVLTTPFLGMMYYFLPKAAEKPIYSYRFSIVHFWSLVFIYIWAGPHHLLYTAVPEWAQTLGMIFSIMLIAPSWGGMINGLLTLRGAGERVKTEPVLKFLVAAILFYGLATFEGPLLSIKSVNALAHYTEWSIGHVHGGALGWNGLLSFGMIYWLVPKLWKTKLYSTKLANVHFWHAIAGIAFYVVSLWIAGIQQGSQTLAMDPITHRLKFPDFMATITAILPYFHIRALGGALYLAGAVIGLYNIWRTIQTSKVSMRPLQRLLHDEKSSAAPLHGKVHGQVQEKGHRFFESVPIAFTLLTLVAVGVASFISIAPTFMVKDVVPVDARIKPYTPLEHYGRDIYLREGCYTCHSQMIRPLVAETLRYGRPSQPQESMYDHPHQWGSKRTGLDLARVGGKYPDLWHLRHLLDPRSMVAPSIMPAYPWLETTKMRLGDLSLKLQVMKQLGVPYSDDEVQMAEQLAVSQAKQIATNLQTQAGAQGHFVGMEDKEILALIAYLQRLGKDGAQP
ncbi:cytochrome-c oxidase, cbb3-type subunit I [Bdellovibrionota bacterium FG-2]